MAEVLTESFCERCGTRYTFESAKPRVKRLGGVKVLSRGLKNFVLSDDSSLDEAMAAARSDTEREVTAQQLDAFHKTFNFCMTCRQYTCANCWNEAEGTCLTCSPHLGHEILPAPFPDLDPLGMTVALGAADVATANGAVANGVNGANGNGHDMPAIDAGAWPTMDAWPTHDLASGSEETPVDPFAAAAMDPDEIDVEARMAALTAIGSGSPATVEAAAVVEAEVEAPVEALAEPAEPIEAEAAIEPEAQVAAEPEIVAAEPEIEAVAEPETEADPEVEAVAAEPEVEAVAAEPEIAPVTPAPAPPAQDRRLTTDEVAALAATQTTALIGRFRPGQSLDAEIEAYEREQDVAQLPTPVEAVVADEPQAATRPDVVVEPESVERETEPVAVAELIVAATVVAADPEPAPVAAEAEVEPIAADPEPEPVVAAEPEPEPEPVATAEREPEPVAAVAAAEPEPEPEPVAADRDAQLAAAAAAAAVAAAAPKPADVVAQPTWRIVAPDADPTPAPVAPPAPTAPVAPPAAATGTAPEWPANPEWPTQRPAAGLPFLGRLAQPTGGLDSLWAESSREVAAAAPVPGRPAPIAGVQPCVSCGLSLSATARFCRRCGTSQHA